MNFWRYLRLVAVAVIAVSFAVMLLTIWIARAID
jgi:hypothetical protein